MSFEFLRLETGAVSVLTLNRPEKLNALNAAVLGELEAALTTLESDPSVQVLLVTGAGEKAFVAGADIGELSACDARAGMAMARRGQTLFARLEAARFATLAVVNGFALGGGLELALACDLRLGSTQAVLGLPEVTLGIIPGYAGTQRLARLIGKGRALELVMTGDKIKADEAHRIGLLNHVVEPADLMAKARELAARIQKAGPLAVAAAKRLVHMAGEVPLDRGVEAEAAAFALLCTSEDKAEGTRAFLEKRKPVFTGR